MPVPFEMASALERYEKLGLRESLSRIYDYPSACKELSFLLRQTYKKLPKNLQAIMFQDTLAAFRLLPHCVSITHTNRGVSAANELLQAAEAALPKQKRALAVAEFKHAVVAHKRRWKAPKDEEEEGSAQLQLPQDVLVHVFSFLDTRSLASVGSVCRSWNSAASDNMLWQLQYALLFGKGDNCYENKDKFGQHAPDQADEFSCKKEGVGPVMDVDWREAFKRTYIGNSPRRSTSNWGYCGHCKSIIWLSSMNCTSLHHHTTKDENRPWKVKPLSVHQVVDYLLGDPLSDMSSSDSDSDSDEAPFAEQRLPKLWAYSRHIGNSKKPFLYM